MGHGHSDPALGPLSTRSLHLPLYRETAQAALRSQQEKLLWPPWHSNGCLDPGQSRPPEGAREGARDSRSSAVSPLAPRAQSCGLSLLPAAPAPWAWDAGSCFCWEGRARAWSWAAARARCPHPSHACPGTVRTPSIPGHRAPRRSTSPDPCPLPPTPLGTEPLALSGPRYRPGTRLAPGKTRGHRPPRTLSPSLV